MASRSMRLLLLLSCLAKTGVLGDIIMRPSCAPGWFYHKSNCYGYFRKLRNWSDAELECQSYGNGAHLASIRSLKEASTIAEYISGYQRSQPIWIGLHDRRGSSGSGLMGPCICTDPGLASPWVGTSTVLR
ncbi:REG4 isoform 2 [Pongo abelii]|uniref:REG4 isoform 1 n=1 Tax=Pongo abelii TaxID=9601 RepID=A0A2J8SQD7_PONAB|nr:REG4 isoform 1 [Pongo abelii]PNJ22991.1 REG4 isoform 2 [Pongo abelii]